MIMLTSEMAAEFFSHSGALGERMEKAISDLGQGDLFD
jgi:hypothetical protein